MKKFFLGIFAGLILGLSIYAIFFDKHEADKQIQSVACEPDDEDGQNIADEKDAPQPEDQEVVAEAEPEEPEALPLEPPPEYHPDMPDEFKTQKPGEFKVQWVNKTPGLRTRVFIYGPDGRELKTNSSKSDFLYIQNIPYTDPSKEKLEYSLKMATANEDKVFGKKSKARKLHIHREHFDELIMPKYSNGKKSRGLASASKKTKKKEEPKKYMAPKILKVIVED